MNHILNRYLPFLMKSPLFCLFWTLFGQFLGTFPIRPVSMIPWLLNWIIFWIESAEYFLNWIIFWIESWVKQYWIEYWMNHFLAKFKHWIESDWVSPTTKWGKIHMILYFITKTGKDAFFVRLFHSLTQSPLGLLGFLLTKHDCNLLGKAISQLGWGSQNFFRRIKRFSARRQSSTQFLIHQHWP